MCVCVYVRRCVDEEEREVGGETKTSYAYATLPGYIIMTEWSSTARAGDGPVWTHEKNKVAETLSGRTRGD